MTIAPIQRQVHFPSSAVFNFRDLGGIPTADGAVVRSGVLFRSDSLSRLTPEDGAAFAALGIRTVIDLRREGEIAEMGRVPEWTGATWLHHHLTHQLWDDATYSEEIGVARWLADRYGELLSTGAADFARVVGVLAEEANGPTAVHCVAGKDRTGLVSALTLDLLGVADDQIAADYALTEQSGQKFFDWAVRHYPSRYTGQPLPQHVFTPAQAMLLTLTELRQRYGSAQEYLVKHGMPADAPAKLRANLL